MNGFEKGVASFALLFGTGLLKYLVPEVPLEAVLTIAMVVPGMWVFPPVAKALGIKY